MCSSSIRRRAVPSICISRPFPFLYQRLALPSRTRFPPELARARAISLLSVSRQVRSSLLLSSMISRSLLDTDSIEQELCQGVISLEDSCTIRFMATHLHDVTVCCRSRLDIWLGRDRQAFFFAPHHVPLGFSRSKELNLSRRGPDSGPTPPIIAAQRHVEQRPPIRISQVAPSREIEAQSDRIGFRDPLAKDLDSGPRSLSLSPRLSVCTCSSICAIAPSEAAWILKMLRRRC